MHLYHHPFLLYMSSESVTTQRAGAAAPKQGELTEKPMKLALQGVDCGGLLVPMCVLQVYGSSAAPLADDPCSRQRLKSPKG